MHSTISVPNNSWQNLSLVNNSLFIILATFCMFTEVGSPGLNAEEWCQQGKDCPVKHTFPVSSFSSSSLYFRMVNFTDFVWPRRLHELGMSCLGFFANSFCFSCSVQAASTIILVFLISVAWCGHVLEVHELSSNLFVGLIMLSVSSVSSRFQS